ncbi:MAG: hypothetical protein WBW92_09955 [Rhodanobacteraceae bacterium]
MTSQRSFFLALSFSAMAGALGASSAQAQSTVIHLNYGTNTCDFITPGISISGATASNIDTQPGQFDFANSTCPQGGGTTGTASVSLAATPGTINAGETAQITWSATADVCRYDGSSLPAALSGWQTSGYACVGASECQAGANYSATFTTAGTYSLKLTCLSGTNNGQPATQQFKTATVQVGGGGGGGGGSANCVAPASMTRQLTGTVSKSSGSEVRNGVDVTSWDQVYGYNITTNQTVPWPGVFGTGPKLYVNHASYWSMKFTVPSNYPYFDPTIGPTGKFITNSSNVTPNLNWTLAISQDCGDFSRPTSQSDPTYICYQTYAPDQGGGLSWAVTPVGSPVSGYCNLERGKTYYFNVAPGSLGTDHSTACTGSVCTINITHGGLF